MARLSGKLAALDVLLLPVTSRRWFSRVVFTDRIVIIVRANDRLSNE
jgi:hypothetical protein